MLENNQLKIKQWAMSQKNKLEELAYSEIMFRIELPNSKASHPAIAGGYKGHPLISFWDTSTNFETAYVVTDDSVSRVW